MNAVPVAIVENGGKLPSVSLVIGREALSGIVLTRQYRLATVAVRVMLNE